MMTIHESVTVSEVVSYNTSELQYNRLLCLGTVGIALLYLMYNCKLEAVSLQLEAKQRLVDTRQLQNISMMHHNHTFFVGSANRCV